jgi:hypothetical protein
VVTTGGATEASADGTLAIKNADSALLLVDLRLLKDAGKSEQDALQGETRPPFPPITMPC